MTSPQSTLKRGPQDQRDAQGDDAGALPIPGLLLVYTTGQPRCVPFPLSDGRLEIGRGDGSSLWPTDPLMSRRHARLSYADKQFEIEDLSSQNGTSVDGNSVKVAHKSARPQVLSTGDSLFLICPDLRPYQAGEIQIAEGRVAGPLLQGVLRQIAQIASFSATLHITGESGTGKEGAAHAFHAAGPNAAGPFVAVNCATIPEGVAERVLFGAKRGAFSGAIADSNGYVQTADGGTLFLDEIADLDPAVQAKLLRVLETREVCQLGSNKPRAVNLQFCSATNKDLRAEVGAGRFREDLYFRLSRPEVEVLPLRHRKEEIPWLIAQVLRAIPGGPTAHASFVEACLLRFWPGNVRELLTEVRAAGQMALAAGKRVIAAHHLATTAGQAFSAEPPADHPALCQQAQSGPSRELIERVLQRTAGNVSAAARLLGMHRTQLKRLMDRLGITASSFNGTPGQEE